MISTAFLLTNPYQWPEAVWLVFLFSIFLCASAFAIVLFIFASRIVKSYRTARENEARIFFRGVLNSIVVQDTFNGDESPRSAFDYKIQELTTAIGSSAFRRNLLIQQIIELRKNLSGSAADSLRRIYYILQLNITSLHKLESIFWKKRAMGLRELGEMKNTDANDKILKFLQSRNSTLRQEAFMALIRINDDNPLKFLNEYQNVLTPWMILNIHLNLQRLDSRSVPDFSNWLDHKEQSVKIFILQMITQFRQLKSLSKVASLLGDEDNKVVCEALKVITELEGYQYRDDVVAIKHRVLTDVELSTAFVQCVGRIGDPVEDPAMLVEFMYHQSYFVRFEAARALRSFGQPGQQLLSQQQDTDISKIVNHLSEPLLQ